MLLYCKLTIAIAIAIVTIARVMLLLKGSYWNVLIERLLLKGVLYFENKIVYVIV